MDSKQWGGEGQYRDANGGRKGAVSGRWYTVAATVMLDLSMVVIPMGRDACSGKQGDKMVEEHMHTNSQK